WGDASLSYFNGYDRGFSLLKPTDMLVIPFIPQFGYRKTDMIGADFVTFIGDITIRYELGYFNTENIYGNNVDMVFDVSADYLQYVFQFEYSGFSDIKFGAQFLGTNIFSADGTTFNGQAPIPLTKDNFTPAMGTPFAMIAEKAIIVNGSGNFFDDRLEVSAMSLINLEETGYMLGMNAGYSPIEDWELKLGLTKFIGDADGRENRFTLMEDFSHLSFGLDFNF
ncbi:MAG: hypothetical protein V3W20_04985, partial [Candidatus Neomarinimicrobiota bacterium]